MNSDNDNTLMDLQGQGTRRVAAERGYAMAALLVGIAVMAVMMSVAMPVWRHEGQREKEAELVFRGEQYARAVALYQRKFPGAFPPNLDVLVQQKFLRRKYKDPMTEDGEFQVLYAGAQAAGQPPGGRAGARSGPAAGVNTGGGGNAPRVSPPLMPGGAASGAGATGVRGGVIGVTSKSKEASIRLYNGRGRYNEWQFVFTAAMASQPGGAVGEPGRPGPGGIDPRTGRPIGPGVMGPGGRGPGGPGGMGPGVEIRGPGQGPGTGRPGGSGPGQQARPPGRPPGRTP
jgi:type II secretory pathway pseudopilin PulG